MIRWSRVVLASLGLTGLALAQPPSLQPPVPPPTADPEAAASKPQRKLGADLAYVMPVDDYAAGLEDQYRIDAAVGLFGRLEIGLRPQLFATGRLGFLYHLVDTEPGFDVSVTMVPIYAGLRYNFLPTGPSLFMVGEAGLNIIRTSLMFMEPEFSFMNYRLSLNGGVGFQAGAFSVKGTLFFTAPGEDLDGPSRLGMMAAAGFDFAL
jgi:hypothetical protein